MWAKQIYCNRLNRREPNNTNVGTNELLQISKVVGPVLQWSFFLREPASVVIKINVRQRMSILRPCIAKLLCIN